jgi:hypothetical protein
MTTNDEHLNTYLLDDPETDPADRRAIEAHLVGCDDCRRSLDFYRRARRLLVPQEFPSYSPHSKDFVDRVFSKVDSKTSGGPAPEKRHRPWAWPAAVGALFAAFAAIAYFTFAAPAASTQDLLAGADGGAFYEWATTSGSPSDEDVLKVVLEGL